MQSQGMSQSIKCCLLQLTFLSYVSWSLDRTLWSQNYLPKVALHGFCVLLAIQCNNIHASTTLERRVANNAADKDTSCSNVLWCRKVKPGTEAIASVSVYSTRLWTASNVLAFRSMCHTAILLFRLSPTKLNDTPCAAHHLCHCGQSSSAAETNIDTIDMQVQVPVHAYIFNVAHPLPTTD